MPHGRLVTVSITAISLIGLLTNTVGPAAAQEIAGTPTAMETTVSVVGDAAAAPLATPAPTATPLPQDTETATITELVPSPTGTWGGEPEAAVAPNEPGAVAPMLLLKAEPDYITDDGKVSVRWVVDGVDSAKSKISVGLHLDEALAAKTQDAQVFDESSRTVSTDASGGTGDLELDVTDASAGQAVIEATLYDGETPLVTSYLALPRREKFEVGMAGASLVARGGEVRIIFPAGALAEGAEILVGPPRAGSLPNGSLSGRAFEIDATGLTSEATLSKFEEPIEIEVSYAHLGLSEQAGPGDVLMHWFNPETREWEALESWVDTTALMVHAVTDHFSIFDISLNDWQAARLPGIPSFQGPNFTGAATYAVPIELPPGPGGWKPDLSLTYNSQVVDSATLSSQAGWAGMGWSINEPAIVLDAGGSASYTDDDTYMLELGGVSERLVRDPNGGGAVWHPANENFISVVHQTSPQDIWIVADKQGNTYYFEDRARFPYLENGQIFFVTYQWSLTRARNIFGKEITYTYHHETTTYQGQYTADTAVYPETIVYPNDRYRVLFQREPRMDYERTWMSDVAPRQHERERLKEIRVEADSDGDATFETLIRRYEMLYEPDSDNPGTSGLMSWWSMDETSGNRSDSHNSNTLTNVNNVGYAAGQQGNAASFVPASGQMLTAADNPEISMGNVDFTIVATVYLNSTVNYMVVANKGDPTNTLYKDYLLSYNNATGGFRFAVGSGTVYTAVESGPVTAGTWHTVIAWHDSVADTLNIQVDNGASASVGFTGGPIDTTHQLTIGAFANGTYGLNGRLDELVLYRRLLTAAERQWLHNEGAARAHAEVDAVIENLIFPGHTYTAGGDVSTLAAIRTHGLNNADTLPEQSFTYGDNLHLTRAENGYGGAVEYTYDQWYYPTEAPASRTRLINDCRAYNTGDWVAVPNAGFIACQQSTLQVAGLVYAPAWAAGMTKPGGVYKITAQASWEDTKQVAVGLSDGHTQLLTSGLQAIIELPADANTAVPLFYVDSPYARVSMYKMELLPSFSRVSQKSLSTGNGTESYVFTYTYTDPAVNDAAHSASACPPNSYCYSAVENFAEFRGHRVVTEEDPYGRVVEVQYHQDDVEKGLQSMVTVSNGAEILRRTVYDYDAVELPIFWIWRDLRRRWIYPSWTEEYTYNGAAFDATRSDYTYAPAQAFGNLTAVTESSWNGAAWVPYRSRSMDYFPNSNGVYLVELPAREQLKNAAGTPLTETLYLYDNHDNYSSPPTAGQLTATRFWVTGSSYGQTSVGYDAWGNTTTVTTYDGYGTASAVPPVGGARTTTTVYDMAYKTYPTDITQPLMPAVHLTYDYAKGVALSETDVNGHMTSATYDDFGRILSLTRPPDSMATLTFAYQDSSPFTTTITQRVDTSSTFTLTRKYDGLGRQFQSNAAGVVTDYGYDAYGRVTMQSTPYAGSEMHYNTTTSYDGLGRPLSVTEPDGRSSTFAYNGLVTTATDPLGRATNTTTDVWGRTALVTPPTGPAVTYAYDERDLLMTTARAGLITTMTYDAAGRKQTMTDPDMGTWQYGYDALGNLTSQTDARNCTLTLTYDLLSRLDSKMSSGAGCGTQVSLNFDYDAGTNGKGNRTSMSDGSGSTTWAYDARGRLSTESKIISGGIFDTHWAHNSADLPSSLSYPDGESLSYAYDSRMMLDTATSPQGDYVHDSQYDSAGRLTSRLLGNDLTQSLSYYGWTENALLTGQQVGQGGGLKSLTTGAMQSLTYLYDGVGNVRSISDATATETQGFGYDALDRLTSAAASNGPAPYSEAYTYDGTTGNLASKEYATLPEDSYTVSLLHMDGTDASTAFTDATGKTWIASGNAQLDTGQSKFGGASGLFDGTGDYVSSADSSDWNFAAGDFTVDFWARFITLPVPGAFQTFYQQFVDGNNRAVFIVYNENGQYKLWLDVYSGGAPLLIFPVTSPGLAANQWYHFAVVRHGYEFTIYQDGITAGTTPSAMSYPDYAAPLDVGGTYGGFYLNGWIDEFRISKGVARWTSSFTPPATPHASGWTSTVYTYSPLHPHGVSSAGTNTYQYDANGNMTQRVVGGQTFNLAYDAENRLVSVTGAITASFVYDGDGKRVKSTIDGVTTYFVGNIYELTGSVATKYYYAGSQRIATRVGTGEPYYLLSDHLGSTTVTTDASGNLVSELRYKPWGEVRAGSAPTSYTFTGQYSNVSDVGLMFYNARWYDPALGRFASADSIVPAGVQGLDRYAYVNNSPVNFTDPSGHAVECDITPGGACGGVGPSMPTLVYDSHGITAAGVYGGTPEQYVNGLNTTWEYVTIPASIVFEPVDWAVTAHDCLEGDCSLWMLAGLLPFVPSSVGRHLADFAAGAAQAETRFIRYMSYDELRVVRQTGFLRGGRVGPTFFTKDAFETVGGAISRLSLPKIPNVALEFEILNSPRLVGPLETAVKYGRLGLGSEYYTLDQVRVAIVRTWDLLP